MIGGKLLVFPGDGREEEEEEGETEGGGVSCWKGERRRGEAEEEEDDMVVLLPLPRSEKSVASWNTAILFTKCANCGGGGVYCEINQSECNQRDPTIKLPILILWLLWFYS